MTEPSIKRATRAATRAAIQRDIEAAAVNEAWAVYKKRKRNNLASTKEEKGKEKEYEQFLAKFMNKHGRLPRSADEDSFMAEFGDFLPQFRKHMCN